jgi:pimeloyl-ACP methyl ester carboxylesterase
MSAIDKVDLLGFSLGGFITQVIARQEPALVRKIILAGTGPAGGEGIVNVTNLTYFDTFKAFATFKDPKEYLFFTRTPNGKSKAREFVRRLKERTDDRDKAVALRAFRAQLKAIHEWGLEKPADLGRIQHPALVVNGDADRMVPTSSSYDLARRLPNAMRRIYPDAGYAGIFQFHERFVSETLEFLGRDARPSRVAWAARGRSCSVDEHAGAAHRRGDQLEIDGTVLAGEFIGVVSVTIGDCPHQSLVFVQGP